MIKLIISKINHFLAKFFDEAYELGFDDGLEERYTKSNEIVRDTPDEENDDDD